MMLNPNDKASYVRMAKEVWEPRFISEIAPRYGLDARANPDCMVDYLAPDLLVNGEQADLKWRGRPFFMAEELYGIPSQYAITLNTNKISRYMQRWPNMRIYAYLEWPRGQDVIRGRRYRVVRKQELWVLSMEQIAQLVWHAPIHTYRERATGNASASYVINLLAGERLSRHGNDLHGNDRH